MAIKRGDIYGVAFPKRDPQGSEIEKTRPCVVISPTSVNEVRRTVIVVPLSSLPEAIPPIAIAGPSVAARSVLVCD